jgi:hypothetical protein
MPSSAKTREKGHARTKPFIFLMFLPALLAAVGAFGALNTGGSAVVLFSNPF